MARDSIKKTTVSPRKVGGTDSAAEGSVVRVHYKGTLESGEVFDSSQGRDPIEFVVGQHAVIKGFEDAVLGMQPGDKKQIKIPPAEAYGEPKDEMRQRVPREAMGEVEPEIGMFVEIRHPQLPQPLPARVLAVDDKEVQLDLNHPLAGKTLQFELELVEIR